MGRLPSWLVVGAVGAVIVLAAADALRSTGDAAPEDSAPAREPTTTADAEPTGLHGVIVVGADCASIRAIRLPTLISFSLPVKPTATGTPGQGTERSTRAVRVSGRRSEPRRAARR